MAQMQAGAAQTDITPHLETILAGSFTPRPAEDIDDPLYSKAVVISDGETKLAIIVLDLITIPREEVQKIRELIFEHTGIPHDHVMIGCTHTHTAPQTRPNHMVPRDEAYMEWLVPRVADSVRLAVRRLQPARIGWGRGEQHDISFCRRFLMKDGTVRMNPGRNADIVRPTSPIDPDVGVVYIEDMNGNPISVVAQFSLHYVGTDNSLAISADYYGHFADAVRRQLGDQCVPLLLNGTSGQINNVNPLGPPRQLKGHAQAKKVALALAGEVMKVIGRIQPVDEANLAAGSVMVDLPTQKITEEDVKIARRILDGVEYEPNEKQYSFVVGHPIPNDQRRTYYAWNVVKLFDMPDGIQSEVQAFRIGESAWVALPGEIFVEIGLAIKKTSSVDDTFVVSLANDALGYIATDHALIEEGGYETWATTVSRVGVGAEGVLVGAAQDLLAKLF